MCPETEEHKTIKEIVKDKLKEWLGASCEEYPDSGHISDILAVTPDGITIFVENIWTSTPAQFLYDMNILQQSMADVKIVIANPKVIEKWEREFEKVKIAQRRLGFPISDMIDGSLILQNNKFLNETFRNTVAELIKQKRETSTYPRREIQSPESLFEKRNWGLRNAPEGTRCIAIQIAPSKLSDSFLDLSEEVRERLIQLFPVHELRMMTINRFPTADSYVIRSLSRSVEVFKNGLIEFNIVESAKEEFVYVERLELFYSLIANFATSVYREIASYSGDIKIHLAMNNVLGKRLTYADEPPMPKDWYGQGCDREPIRIMIETRMPIDVESTFEQVLEQLMNWFRRESGRHILPPP